MNPLNYGSLEACKRLKESGIVLKYMDKAWIHDKWKDTWELGIVTPTIEFHPERWEFYMAPSMAEVLRELPEGFEHEGEHAYLCITKSRKKDNTFYAAYFLPNDLAVCGSRQHNANPTDALIDLLIWITEQKRKEE